MEPKKGNRRAQMTRRLIQDALVELLETKPIDKISVSELCELADINRTTFYNHYAIPQDVLFEVGERIAADMLGAVSPEAGSPQLPLADQVAGICRYLQAHMDKARFLLAHFTADDEIVKFLLSSRITSGQVAYRAGIAGYDDATRRLLDEFVSHGVYSLVRCWLLEGVDKTPEDIGALAAEIAGDGWIE